MAALSPTLTCKHCGHTAVGLALGTRCPTDASVLLAPEVLSEHPDDTLLGRVVGGKFAIVDVLGVGGFGAVYRAIQSPVGRHVAVKIIHPQNDTQGHLRTRFFREAKVVSRLSDSATVTLYDYGEGSDGQLYMVFELIEGRPLGAVLRGGRLSPDRVPPLLIQILGALAEAHRIGCVHRDLKPGNIMIARGTLGDETAKVLDFGIAKVGRGETPDPSLELSMETREGVVLGTPKFMSPEQARGQEVDSRSDLYSLGCVAYAMLAGRPPFDGGSAVDILMAHVGLAPTPFAPALGVPPALEAIVLRALAKDPAARFQTAEDMARALLDLVGGGRTSERMAAVPPPAPPLAQPQEPERTSQQMRGELPSVPVAPTARRPVGMAVAAAAIVVGAGVAAWSFLNAGTTPAPTHAPIPTPPIPESAPVPAPPSSAPPLPSAQVVTDPRPGPPATLPEVPQRIGPPPGSGDRPAKAANVPRTRPVAASTPGSKPLVVPEF